MKGAVEMADVVLPVELPAEIAALLGDTREAAAAKARQAVVLNLLRDARISQGRAGELLGLTRHDIIDLMAAYDIPSGPETIEELRRDVEEAEEFLKRQASRGGRD